MSHFLSPLGAVFDLALLASARATLLLVGALAISKLLTRSSAAARHAFWTVTAVALLVLPWTPGLLPVLPLPAAARADGKLNANEGEVSRADASSAREGADAANGLRVKAPSKGDHPAAEKRVDLRLDASSRELLEMAASADGRGHHAEGVGRRDNVKDRAAEIALVTESASTRATGSEESTTRYARSPNVLTELAEHQGRGVTQALAHASASVVARIPASGEALVVLLWALGLIAALTSLAIGVLRVRGIARAAKPLESGEWEAAATDARERLGLDREVAMGSTPATSVPMTGGVIRPFVLVPESAESWTSERRSLVLLHELVHVAQHDALRQMISRLTSALYWFHPLAHVVAKRALLAREQACDEAVVALGWRPSVYARHLLELSETAASPLPVLGLVDRTQLEKRMMAILKPGRRSSRHATLAATACAAVWAITVAATAPAVRDETPTPARTSESALRTRELFKAPNVLGAERRGAPVYDAVIETAGTSRAGRWLEPHVSPREFVALPVTEPVPPSSSDTIPVRMLYAPSWEITPFGYRPASAHTFAWTPKGDPGTDAVKRYPTGYWFTTEVPFKPASFGSLVPLHPGLGRNSPLPGSGGADASQRPEQERSCWLDSSGDVVLRNVRGSVGGTGVVTTNREVSASGDRVVQTHVGDADVCIRTHGTVNFSDDLSRIESVADDGWVVMASKTGARTVELTLTPSTLGLVLDWKVDGVKREFGAEAAEWRDAMVPILGSYLDLMTSATGSARLTEVAAARAADVSKLTEALDQTRRELTSAAAGNAAARAQVEQQLGELKRNLDLQLQQRGAEVAARAARLDDAQLELQREALSAAYGGQLDAVRYQLGVAGDSVVVARERLRLSAADAQRPELEKVLGAVREIEATQQALRYSLELKAREAASAADQVATAGQKLEAERLMEAYKPGLEAAQRLALEVRLRTSSEQVDRLMEAIRRIP